MAGSEAKSHEAAEVLRRGRKIGGRQSLKRSKSWRKKKGPILGVLTPFKFQIHIGKLEEEEKSS
jgi:hypothetical protein